MNICKGIVKYNKKCRNKVVYGEFCSHHMNQRPIFFYPLIDDWPPPNMINKEVRKYKTYEYLLIVIRKLYKTLLEESKFVSEYLIKYNTRLFFMSVLELLKYNKNICYEIVHHDFNKMCNVLMEKFVTFPEFNDYIIDFQKQCIKSYRDQAKKKVYLFYFKHVEGLCFDVVEKIINLV